jgi:predicted DCC family thiol-disulfide oxidoreductase YuxK
MLSFIPAHMNEWQFKLLYDGECPLCRREIDWLRRHCRDGRLVFEDIAAPGFEAARYGLTQGQVMGVMHGIFPDGRVVTKVEAFRQAYRLVGLGWLVAPTGWPVLRGMADWAYEGFARHRVSLGRWLGAARCQGDRCRPAVGKK